jgi:twitching motility protein PilT
VPRADGRGRVAAVEILRATARTRELIEDKDRTKELHDAISQGTVSYGMQTFDQSLMKLLTSHLITYEEALRQATNPDDFALRVSGIGGTSDSSWDGFDQAMARPQPGMAAPTAPPQPAAPQYATQPPQPGYAAPMQPRPSQPAMPAAPPGLGSMPPQPSPFGAVSTSPPGFPRPVSGPQPAAPRPAPVPAPAAPAAPGGNDDFTIERF